MVNKKLKKRRALAGGVGRPLQADQWPQSKAGEVYVASVVEATKEARNGRPTTTQHGVENSRRLSTNGSKSRSRRWAIYCPSPLRTAEGGKRVAIMILLIHYSYTVKPLKSTDYGIGKKLIHKSMSIRREAYQKLCYNA